MIIYTNDEYQVKLDKLTHQLYELAIKNGHLEGEVKLLREQNLRFVDEIKVLRDEKKSILDDLLIAVGVKQNDLQRQLLERELTSSTQKPQFNSQTRSWAHNMTQEGLEESFDDKKRFAREFIDEIEKDFVE